MSYIYWQIYFNFLSFKSLGQRLATALNFGVNRNNSILEKHYRSLWVGVKWFVTSYLVCIIYIKFSHRKVVNINIVQWSHIVPSQHSFFVSGSISGSCHLLLLIGDQPTWQVSIAKAPKRKLGFFRIGHETWWEKSLLSDSTKTFS